MSKVLYTVWLLLPLLFFTLSFWAKLEQLGRSRRKQNPGDFFRQGVFVLGCVGVAVLLDRYVLPSLHEHLSPRFLPIEFYQVLLLPLVLYLGAKVVGPSKQILITKAPRPTDRTRK